MGSLDIGLLSINISLDEAINTCVNRLFETLTLLKVLQSRKLNKCFFGYKGVLFHIQQLTYKKNNAQQWNHLLDIPLLTHFLHKKKITGQTLVQKQSNQIFTNVISSIFFRRFFFLTKSNNHLKYFQKFLFSCHISISFSMEQKNKHFPFFMLKLFAKQKNVQPQFIANLRLAAYIVTLKEFYILFINLVWYTP